MRLIARAIRTQSRLIWKCLSSSLLSPLFQIKLRWHRWLSPQCLVEAGAGRRVGTPCPAGVFTGMALVGFCLWGFYSQLSIPVLLHRGPPEPPRSCLGIAILQQSQGCDCSQSWGLALIFLIDLLKKIKIIKGILMGIRLRRAL